MLKVLFINTIENDDYHHYDDYDNEVRWSKGTARSSSIGISKSNNNDQIIKSRSRSRRRSGCRSKSKSKGRTKIR